MVARRDGDGGVNLRLGHSDCHPIVEGGTDDHLALGKMIGDAGQREEGAEDA
jgi:hypothetical protein